MKLERLDIESMVLNEELYEITDFLESYKDFLVLEPDFIRTKYPDYIQIGIGSALINHVHFFEDHGFRFIVFKISRRMKLDNAHISKSYLYPFISKNIADRIDLKKNLSICQKAQFDDPFTQDKHYSKEITINRIKAFINQSFSKKDEFVIALINSLTDEVIGFQTGKFFSKNHVILSMNSTIEGLDNEKYREICDHLLLNWLKEHNVLILDASSTGSNLTELNISIKKQGFEIQATNVVLRKLYEYN